MPIHFEGPINGKIHNGVLPVGELIRAFPALEDIMMKGGKYKDKVELRLPPKRIAKGKKYGMVSSPISVTNTISGTYEGDSYIIRFYKNVRRPTNANMQAEYLPRKHQMNGAGTVFYLNRDKDDREKCAYFILHRWCKDSPFFKNRSQPKYVVHRPEIMAAKAVVEAQSYVKLLKLILDDKVSVDTLRYKARGLSGALSIGSVEGMDKSVLQAKLLELAKKHPDQFLTSWNENNTQFDGILHRAVDIGLFERKPTGGGVFGFYYNADYSLNVLKSAEPIKACNIPRNSPNEFLVLKQHILKSASGTIQLIQSYIGKGDAANAADENPDVAQALNQDYVPSTNGGGGEYASNDDLKSMPTENLIALGFQYDMLYFDRGSSKVHFIKGGQIDTEICTIDSPGDYKSELAAKITGLEPQKKLLVQKLNMKFISLKKK